VKQERSEQEKKGNRWEEGKERWRTLRGEGEACIFIRGIPFLIEGAASDEFSGLRGETVKPLFVRLEEVCPRTFFASNAH